MTMSKSEAYQYAASWGSYMTAGDPGAIMYGFDETFTMQSEQHRADVLAYIEECRKTVTEHPDWYDSDELEKMDEFVAACKAAPCDESELWFTSSSGTVEIKMTYEQAKSVSRPGQSADGAVAALRAVPEIATQLADLDADELRDELREYGAWDDTELADHDANLNRILWQAGCDIIDNYQADQVEAAEA